MRRTFLLVISALLVATQLSGCVVYERPYPHYYYHGWYYR